MFSHHRCAVYLALVTALSAGLAAAQKPDPSRFVERPTRGFLITVGASIAAGVVIAIVFHLVVQPWLAGNRPFAGDEESRTSVNSEAYDAASGPSRPYFQSASMSLPNESRPAPVARAS